MEGVRLIFVSLSLHQARWKARQADFDCRRPAMEPTLHEWSNGDDDPIVLVIDDDPDVREALGALLDSVNLKSKVFGATPEFFRYKLPDKVSCLIVDIRLPGLGGLDLQIELAKLQIDIPIIFITGHGDISMSVQAMRAGAVEFLTKPFREQDILDAVRTALDHDHRRREHHKRTHNLRIRFSTLSPREREVMGLVATGLMNKQIAAEIGIAEVTVKVHRHNVMKKLAAKSFPDLVRMADVLGLPPKA
jgi:FixJ family two-component response regulator